MSNLAKIRCGQIILMLGCLILGACLAPIIAGSAQALGAGVLAAAGIVIGGMVVRNATQRESGAAAEMAELRDMIARWQHYARHLERKSERVAQLPQPALPTEVEAVRARIAAEAETVGAAVQSLLNHAIAFRVMNAGLDTRLAQAEAERDAAIGELAIVDEMEARRRDARAAPTPAGDDTCAAPAAIAATIVTAADIDIELPLADLIQHPRQIEGGAAG